MKTIYIFTKSYPYSKTEAFLESEILELSRYFDNIVVLPAFEDEYLRNIPENVTINKSFIIHKRQRIFSLIIAIFGGRIFKSLLKHLFKIKSIKDIKNILRYSIYEVYFIKRYKKSVIDFNGSILYSYWFGHFVNALQQIIIKFNLDTEIITRAHRWDIYENEHGLFPYRQKNIDMLKALYVISCDGKKYLENRYGNSQKIKIARLGVYDKRSISKPTSENIATIISVSQVTHRKRIFLLLDSLITYAHDNPSVKVGWIHFGTGTEMNNLQAKIKKLKIKNLKIELKGYVLNTEILKFYKSNEIDVFINLSESEGVPVSIMEAQSFGIPVIATNVGGTGEIVDNDVGVLLNNSPTTQQVSKAIDSVLKKNFNRNFIKRCWNGKSSAKNNYKEFTKELLKI